MVYTAAFYLLLPDLNVFLSVNQENVSKDSAVVILLAVLCGAQWFLKLSVSLQSCS